MYVFILLRYIGAPPKAVAKLSINCVGKNPFLIIRATIDFEVLADPFAASSISDSVTFIFKPSLHENRF